MFGKKFQILKEFKSKNIDTEEKKNDSLEHLLKNKIYTSIFEDETTLKSPKKM